MKNPENEVFEKIDKLFAKYEEVDGFQVIADIDNSDWGKTTDDWTFYNNTLLGYNKSEASKNDVDKFNAEFEPEFKKFEFYRDDDEDGMITKIYILKKEDGTVISVLKFAHEEDDYVYTVESCKVSLKNLDLYLGSSHTDDDED